jgi:hypothetical protein
MKIHGLENMSGEELTFEVQRGGRFVMYSFCVSVIIVTFRRSSDVFFLRSGENAIVKGLPYTLLTLLMGWWGIPWGPIYSVQCLVRNLKGGKDITASVMANVQAGSSAASGASAST